MCRAPKADDRKWTENAQPMRWVHISFSTNILLEAKSKTTNIFTCKYHFCFGFPVMKAGAVSTRCIFWKCRMILYYSSTPVQLNEPGHNSSTWILLRGAVRRSRISRESIRADMHYKFRCTWITVWSTPFCHFQLGPRREWHHHIFTSATCIGISACCTSVARERCLSGRILGARYLKEKKIAAVVRSIMRTVS